MNVIVDINEDQSGTAAFEFGLDEEFLEIIESTGGTVDDLFGDLDLGAEGGEATVRRRRHDFHGSHEGVHRCQRGDG